MAAPSGCGARQRSSSAAPSALRRRALRDNPLTAGVPIILLTAKAQEAEVERGFEAGVDDYIVKPFSPREMLSRIQAVLARSEARA